MKKLVKGKFPVAPFNYLISEIGYGVFTKNTEPKKRALEMQEICRNIARKSPKFFAFNDIEAVVENGKRVVLVDMSYYKKDAFIQHFMWFEALK